MSSRTDSRRWVAELIGTFFLVLIGPGAVMVNAATHGTIGHAGVALAFAFVIVAMIFALGHISGAHFNPAVTLGFWSARRFPTREVLPYIAAQCIGATLASYALLAILGNVGSMGATFPSIAPARAFFMEWLLSFGLMFVIMAVATDDRAAKGSAALAVGLTVGFCAMMGGPLTGASMNPARSLGPAIVGQVWTDHWIYWLAPVSAALVAVRLYEFLRPVSPLQSGEILGVEGPVIG